MTDKRPLASPEELWRSQTKEEPEMTLEEIRRKALQFQQRIARRNVREYVSIGVATCLFIGLAWFLPGPVLKTGAVLILIGAWLNVYQLRRDGSAREVPAEASAGECLEFHRRELIRQKSLLDRVGRWQIGPVLPGMAVFVAGAWMLKPGFSMAVSTALTVAVFAFVYRLNVCEAKRLQREIDALGRE